MYCSVGVSVIMRVDVLQCVAVSVIMRVDVLQCVAVSVIMRVDVLQCRCVSNYACRCTAVCGCVGERLSVIVRAFKRGCIGDLACQGAAVSVRMWLNG